MYLFLINLPRWIKALILLGADLVAIVIAYYLAFVLRLNDLTPFSRVLESWQLLILLLLTAIVLTFALRMHAVKLAGDKTSAVERTAVWVFLITTVGTISNLVFNLGAPRTVPVIFGVLTFIFAIAIRFIAISFLNRFQNFDSIRIPVAVYGAGAGGQQLIAALKNSREYRPALFVDDNKNLEGVIIAGLRVYPPSSLKLHLKSGRIEKVFLAMPSLSASKKRQLAIQLKVLDCEILELPSYIEIIESGGILKSLRHVLPEQLLVRDRIEIDMSEIIRTYAGANIMVSGAGGSIGAEICKRIIDIGPKRLVLFDCSEFNLYSLERELRSLVEAKGIELPVVLGSICDGGKISSVLRKFNVDILFHAAAYKHVPLLEVNEVESVRNNVLGTETLAKAAIKHGVRKFILISTDKAVKPTNIMGASKRFAELVIQGLHESGCKTIFSIVRFGNVLGSSGSIIPLFKAQIESGGPVTLTHPDVTRYFMTIPEASRLVLLSGSFSKGGEVFVLDMGQPVKIYDLARQMIELSGLQVLDEKNPDGDIEILVTGLRAGEKLYEELLIGGESLPTIHPKIMWAREKSLPDKELKKALALLRKAVATNDAALVRKTLKCYISDYHVQK